MKNLSVKNDGYKFTVSYRDEITESDLKHLGTLVKEEVKKYMDTVDRANPASELSLLNNSIKSFTASRDFFDYFSDAIHWFGITDGIFNPFLISALDDIKEFKTNHKNWEDNSLFKLNNPTRGFPKQISELSDYLDIDYTNYTIKKLRPVIIDLSGISKGKFIDRIGKAINEILDSYILRFGGDAYFKTAEGNKPWVIKVNNPVNKKLIMELNASNEAVSISGKLGNKKIVEPGHEYMLLNPSSRLDVADDLAMVLIKSNITAKTDVLAKSFFIANEQERAKLAKKFSDITRVEVSKDGKVIMY